MPANPQAPIQTTGVRSGSRCRTGPTPAAARHDAGPAPRGEYGSLGRIVRARRRLRDGVYDRDDVLDQAVERLLARLS